MRLATLRQGAAVLEGDAAYPLPLSVLQMVELGLERALEVGAESVRNEPVPFAESDLLLPYKPPSIRDFVTFESHVEGVRRSVDNADGVPEAWYDAPHFYFTNPHALYGPGEAIPRPVACRALDFEMEVGVVVGAECRSVTEEEAEAAIFGYTIVNDWSARDLQSWEYQPLGPFLGKSFATSISPWVVPLTGLDNHRTEAPSQDPTPLPYLLPPGQGLDIDLEVTINGSVVSSSNTLHLYWTMSQQLAHATSNGATIRAGDLFASGTISGPTPDSLGSLLEITANGQTGDYLRDGDTVVLASTVLGSCSGTVVGSRPT